MYPVDEAAWQQVKGVLFAAHYQSVPRVGAAVEPHAQLRLQAQKKRNKKK